MQPSVTMLASSAAGMAAPLPESGAPFRPPAYAAAAAAAAIGAAEQSRSRKGISPAAKAAVGSAVEVALRARRPRLDRPPSSGPMINQGG